jgi:hypothetical protein
MKTWPRLTLITMTVGGGFAGVLLTLTSLFNSQSRGVIYLVFVVGFLAMFLFVMASGLLFVHDPRRVRPLFAALTIQTPWISTPLLVYKFAAGFHLAVSIGSTQEPGGGVHSGFKYLLCTTYRFGLLEAGPWSIGINLAALALLILLWTAIQTSRPTVQQATVVPAVSEAD